MTKDMLSFYNGNKPGGTPGLLPDPYYWWEGGAMMGSLVDYWYYTGDDQFNSIATDGLLWQVGPNNDYMPPNQTLTEGNDDQGFWGLSVMTAAEYKFPDPPAGKPQWLALAQAVFNTQAARWETADCSGGLRWQIFTWNNGYTYKNSISQACFFNLAARLLLYTGNSSYGDWAVKTWDWMNDVKFMDDRYYVFDGAHIEHNCTDITPYQWTYNAGAFLLGAAAMYNYTSLAGDDTNAALWKERVTGMVNGTSVFFTGDKKNIMTEVACETVELCDLDQQSFKAYLSRWMAATTKWAPWTSSTIMPLLEASSVAAASQCTGGDNGQLCGLRWTQNGQWDNTTGIGQQMAAMEVTLANMINYADAPATNSTGGTSQGDPNAGGSDIGRTDPGTSSGRTRPIHTADRVGAGILTALVSACLVAGVIYMLIDETDERTPVQQLDGFVAAVGKNGKRLARRGTRGDGTADGGTSEAILSEKGNQTDVRQFNGIDGTDSDRSVVSQSLNGADEASRTRQHSVQSTTAGTAPPDPEKGEGGLDPGQSSHHAFFSPAHFRRSRPGTGNGIPANPPSGVLDSGATGVQQPPAAVQSPRRASIINRKPTPSNAQLG